jgi:hypothetical protein
MVWKEACEGARASRPKCRHRKMRVSSRVALTLPRVVQFVQFAQFGGKAGYFEHCEHFEHFEHRA